MCTFLNIIQENLNNREIAIAIFISLLFLFAVIKSPSELLNVIRCLFNKKFCRFYLFSVIYIWVVTSFLKYINFWEPSLIKDTVFFVIFVFLPTSARVVSNMDKKIFYKLCKEAVSLTILFEFFTSSYTFSLFWEIVIVFITFIIGACLAIVENSKDNNDMRVKKFLNNTLIYIGFLVVLKCIVDFYEQTGTLLNVHSLKLLLLPSIYLILTVPFLYIYNIYVLYQEVTVRLKIILEDKKLYKFAVRLLIKTCFISKNRLIVCHHNIYNDFYGIMTLDEIKVKFLEYKER